MCNTTTGGLNLNAAYYNCDLSVWEPFIEPWNITLKVSIKIIIKLFLLSYTNFDQGFVGKFNEKHVDLGETVRTSQQSLAEGESESSDDESEAEMKFIRKTVKSRGNATMVLY